MLECVINVSEGRRRDVIDRIASAGGSHVLDVHADADHHRSVITVVGEDAAFAVVRAAIEAIDLRAHDGVHPRLGAADVVPFVPLRGSTMADAMLARDRCAARITAALEVPCFLYGVERSLPDVRRGAFTTIAPDLGVAAPHVTAGACCVGARPVLVAYNVWLQPGVAVDDARRVAASLRGPALRTLALAVRGGDQLQVSCNLVDPFAVGPAMVFDQVAAALPVSHGELVGLVPRPVLDAVPPARWQQLGLSDENTIEARLREAGLDGGSW